MPRLGQRRGLSSIPILLSLSKLFSLPFSLARPTAGNVRSATWILNAAKDAPIKPEDPPDSPIFWWKLGLSAALVLLGGVFAGLTLALMGSDDLNLRVLSTSSDDPTERKAAAKVLRLLARGRHWVLVVLLLGNVIVNESLPIFLDDVLGGGLSAVIVSTTMIVIFGEIIPQAVCVRYGLQIGGACAPFVLGLMILFFPIAYPIAKLLDYVLGRDEGHTYKKAELKSFLQFHREGEEPLRDDEIGILNGVLSLNEKHVQEIMTPIKDCLTLPADKVLDHQTIDQILLSGFSRIPIHEPGQTDNFIGMLLVKRLITYNPEDEWPISKLSLLPLPEARPDINCFQALDYFQTGRAHLLLISETPGRRGGALGIVSLEDLIEEIIGEEIVDETDRYQDNRSRQIARRAGTGAVMRGIIERHRTTINAIGALSRRSSARALDGRESIQHSVPSGTSDGLLIQFNDGALVAEPVAISDDTNEAVRVGGKRFVVGNNQSGTPDGRMESINERISTQGSPRIAVHHATGDDEPHENGDAGDKKGDQDGDLLGDELDQGVEENGRSEEVMEFPRHQDFESAARAFIARYEGQEYGTGPSRTNKGWEWRVHPKQGTQHHGYMYRRTTRHVPLHQNVDDQDVPDMEEMDGPAEDDAGDDDHDPSEHRRLLDPSVPQSSSTVEAERSKQTDRVEVEHHIIYSRTYHVPQLMLRAWDSTGAPLSLVSLISSGILRPGSQVQSSPSIDAREDALLLDAHSPFPLIQQVEHPTTGEVVWGIHPCQVSLAVDEVLSAENNGVECTGSKRGTSEVERRVKWLETWTMITSGVVDLSYGHA